MGSARRTYQEHWDLILIGAAIVGLVCTLPIVSGGGPRLSNPLNIWVFVLAVLVSKAAALAPGFLFLLFSCGFFFRPRAKTTAGQLWISGALIGTVFGFSSLFYIISWKYREVYTPAQLYNGWLLISLMMAGATAGLFYLSVRSQKPQALIMTHALLFVWFFSYAFPYIGELP